LKSCPKSAVGFHLPHNRLPKHPTRINVGGIVLAEHHTVPTDFPTFGEDRVTTAGE